MTIAFDIDPEMVAMLERQEKEMELPRENAAQITFAVGQALLFDRPELLKKMADFMKREAAMKNLTSQIASERKAISA